MTDDPTSQLRTRLRADLLEARKARRTDEVAVLRTVIAAVENAEAVVAGSTTGSEGPIAGAAIGVGTTESERHALDADEFRAVVQTELDERLTGAEQYRSLGQQDAADRLDREAAILRRYL